jgi:hypothetical protein
MHRGTMSNLYKIAEQIENLEHSRNVTCPKCLSQQEIQCLDIYADCSDCQTHFKVRGFSANIEVEDVIAQSLVWLIRDDKFDEIVEKYKRFVIAEEN